MLVIIVLLVFNKQSHDYHHNCGQHYDLHYNHKHNRSHNHHHKDGGDAAAAAAPAGGDGGVNDCGGDGNGGWLVFLVNCASK